MKNKRVIRIFSALLAVMLCMTVFSTAAFAGGAEPDGSFVQEAGAVSEPDPEETGEVDLSETLSILFGALLNDGEEPVRMGTVTTNGGRLNVRTGAGLDNYAFTQLPNGTVVEVIGTDGDWYKIRLPEKIGYVHSGYMTLSGGEANTTGSGLPLSFDNALSHNRKSNHRRQHPQQTSQQVATILYLNRSHIHTDQITG